MRHTPLASPPLRRSLLAVLCAASASIAWADSPPVKPAPAATAAPAGASGAKKDVVLDRPDAIGQIAQQHTPATATPTAAPLRPVNERSLVGSTLAELGLDLLRQQTAQQGRSDYNSVVSPLSLGYALGLLHAGVDGPNRRELDSLLGNLTLGERIYTRQLPALRQAMTPGAKGVPFVMANRVWLDQRIAAQVQPSYAASVSQRYGADGVALDFAQTEPARAAINQWISKQTNQRIPELMPAGSLSPATRLVLTNAVHFKSPWAEPFDPVATAPRPFILGNGQTKNVPTMSDERPVRRGTVDNIEVLELPFAHKDYALLIGMPPAGHTLQAFETDLDGPDLQGWSRHLDKAQTCALSLPKFTLTPPVQSLKRSLNQMGVTSLFTDQSANFSPMLGAAAKGLALDDIYQGASIIIDETGGEAAAATGAAVSAKSFRPPAPACAVNRAFIFAVMHLPTGTPLFVGKVADPSQP